MNNRERILRTLRFEPTDRIPDFEFGAWEQTLTRWHEEGMPKEYDGEWTAIDEYFNTDKTTGIGINTGLFPDFEYKVLEEKNEHLIVQDTDGTISEMMKPELGASIPRFLKYPISNRKDWEKIREERLNPDDAGRIPQDIDIILKKANDGENPVSVRCGSLYGWLRNWMGVENLSYAVYDEPEWVEEMMEHLTQLTLSVLEKIAGKVKIDFGVWWEDMCFRSGPLLSPEFFSKWMVPRYKRVTGFLKHEFGCEFNSLDCDGNIHALVPLWLEGGVNVMFPLEAAHTDAHRISHEFGNKVALMGYFDKRALIEGKKAIDREFERILPLIGKGGFIPYTDHLVPPDVSWENYCYYRERKCRILGKRSV